jgi:hypothetical protein
VLLAIESGRLSIHIEVVRQCRQEEALSRSILGPGNQTNTPNENDKRKRNQREAIGHKEKKAYKKFHGHKLLEVPESVLSNGAA